MGNSKRCQMVFLALVIAIGVMGVSFQPAQAATCTSYHTVRAGQSLSWIGQYYGVSWTYLAQINNIKRPYVIYTGQRLCISSGSTSGGTVVTQPYTAWSFAVVGVNQGKTVTIQTYNFPDNVLYSVEIGCWSCDSAPVKVADLDSDRGGTFKKVFSIPIGYSATPQLLIRLTQVNNGKLLERVFNNTNVYGSSGAYGSWVYHGIPTFSITSVVKGTSVTIRTNNFPSGLKFDVLMGAMGTHGVGGYKVGTLDSGAGGTLVATFAIPSQLSGARQIAIRTQNTATGFFSYNWFYNSTAP